VTVELTGRVFFWKGPAPFYFVATPADQTRQIAEVARHVSYGWGCIPCNVTVGGTTTYTALIPKDGSYLVPLKALLRRAEGIEEGDEVALTIELSTGRS
jgi:hypothetical protein